MKISENLHFERYDAVEEGILRHILRQAKKYQNKNIRKDLTKLDKFEGRSIDINRIKEIVKYVEDTTHKLHPKRLRDKSYKRDADDNYVLDQNGNKILIKNGTTRLVEAVCTFNIDNTKPLTPDQKAKFDSWKKFYLDELDKTLPKTWVRLFVAEHHDEVSQETGTINSHIHQFFIPLGDDQTLNAREHLKFEKRFISLETHNERKKRLEKWAKENGIEMKLPEEMNKIVRKRIQDLKESTRMMKSQILTAETVEDFEELERLKAEKLKEVGLRIEDMDQAFAEQIEEWEKGKGLPKER